MYAIDSRLKNKIYSGGLIYTPIVKIGTTTIPNSNIEYINVDNPIIDKTSQFMYLGTFVSTQIELKLHNAISLDLTKQIDISVLIEDSNNNTINATVPIGLFNIETTPTDYYKTAKIVALDNAVKLKNNIDISVYFNQTTHDISVLELLQAICTEFGLQLTSYPNVNTNMRTASYDNTLSAKQYVSWCAELMGGYAKIGRDGNLIIVPAKSTSVETITYTSGKSFTFTENYVVGKVGYDNGKISPSYYPDSDTSNNVLFVRNDNIFINGDETHRDTIIENIYTAISGLTIASLTFENKIDITLDSYDIVTLTDGTNSYQTYYGNSYKINTYMGKVEISIPTKNQEATTNVIKGNETEVINTIKTTIDQVNASLETTITRTQSLQNQVNSNYDEIIDKMSELPSEADYQELRTELTTIQTDTYTKQQINAIITGTDTSGNVVQYVKSGSATFDINGLTIDDSESKVKSTHSAQGLEVIDKTDNTELLFAGFDSNIQETVVRSKNINVEKYFTIGTNSRFEDYMDENSNFGTGCFWVGD